MVQKIIMDGKIPHKPRNPYETKIKDLIIVNFEKNDTYYIL